VVVVARPNKTRRALLKDAVELLGETNTTELDIVLVGARPQWVFNRANSQRTKTIEVTPTTNGTSNRTGSGKRTLAELGDGPWAVPRVPSSSNNGH
jgi:hypothetical protein